MTRRDPRTNPERAVRPFDEAGSDDVRRARSKDPQRTKAGDALDDTIQLRDDDDLPLDAIDELAERALPEQFETVDTGDRRPPKDEAEMGMGAEARSVDEIAEITLGDNTTSTTSEGLDHGEDFLDNPNDGER